MENLAFKTDVAIQILFSKVLKISHNNFKN